jgi:16S rRNA (guanine(966)-N(2))-methyltransferase RsmD
MRIIAGQRRGLVLSDFEAPFIRPTKDQVRESIFNMVAHVMDLSSARVCDLCAGSGGLGLEALSRGAISATFVEHHPEAVLLIMSNLKKARFEASAEVVEEDVQTFLGRPCTRPFDLILADPPYGQKLGEFVVEKVWANGYLRPLGVLVVETEPGELLAVTERHAALRVHRRRKWGRTLVTVIQRME